MSRGQVAPWQQVGALARVWAQQCSGGALARAHFGGDDELISAASLLQPPADVVLSLPAVRGVHRRCIDLCCVDEVSTLACTCHRCEWGMRTGGIS